MLCHELLGFQTSAVSGGLRTVGAILAAPTCLYGEQGALLHFPEVMGMSMDLSPMKEEIEHGGVVDGLDLIAGPIVSGTLADGPRGVNRSRRRRRRRRVGETEEK